MSDGDEMSDEEAAARALSRGLASMAEGFEGMLAASIRLQILMLEEAQQTLDAMGAKIDSGAHRSDNRGQD